METWDEDITYDDPHARSFSRCLAENARLVRKHKYDSELEKVESRMKPGDKILRLADVEKRIGVKKSNIYVFIRKGTFPKPVRLGSKSVGWVESEIDSWLKGLIEQRDKESALDRLVKSSDDLGLPY